MHDPSGPAPDRNVGVRLKHSEQRVPVGRCGCAFSTSSTGIFRVSIVTCELSLRHGLLRIDPVRLYFWGGTSLSKAYGLIRRFPEEHRHRHLKADLKVPLEADIAALASVNQLQKALAEQIDKASRQYIAAVSWNC